MSKPDQLCINFYSAHLSDDTGGPRLAGRQGGQIAIALQSLEGLVLILIFRLR